jgi:imidazolonepropionase-like amidohydrolase
MRRTKLTVWVAVAAAVAAWSAHASGQAPANRVTAFQGARVIVGDGRVLDNATIIVDGGRITRVGTGNVQAPQGATRVDLTGKTVMPGIVDSHVHLSRTREMLLDDLQRRPYYGVVAAFSMGQDPGDLPNQVRAEAEKMPFTARFRHAGRGMTAPEPGRSDVPHWLTTPEEARKAVREEAARKVDIIKIWIDDRDDMFKKLTPELYGAVIDEAHKAGLRTTAHIFELADAKGAVKAGLDAFAHVPARDRDMDDEFAALVRQRRNLMLVPNLPARGVPTDLSWLSASIPAAELQKIQAGNRENAEQQKAFGIQGRNLVRLSKEGVSVAMGTDGNTPWAAHVEMEDMVAAGLTPAQVITAATKNGADYLRIADLGTIEQNKSADFIVLDANPLDDIRNTRKINAVYVRGAQVPRAELAAKWMGRATN